MRPLHLIACAIVGLVLAITSHLVAAQISSSSAIERRPLDVSDQLDIIRSKITNSVPIRDVTISGRTVWDHDAIVARQLVFAPDAELAFSRRTLEKRSELFVIASSIVAQDPQRPGRITWEGSNAPPGSTTDSSTSAPPGQNGLGDGAAGLPGLPGAQGVAGAPGENAPALFLFVSHLLPGSRLAVRLEGKSGGDGSPGQSGGAGGSGSRGESASQSAFDCKRGPGYGGSGASGGNGGVGGAGGAGGHGGVLTVLSATPNLDGIRFLGPGGLGGHGGSGGKGGPGGQGGPEGPDQLPWCRPSGRTGAAGSPGKDAADGPDGPRGHDGELYVVRLSDELVQRIASDLDTPKCTWFGLFCR